MKHGALHKKVIGTVSYLTESSVHIIDCTASIRYYFEHLFWIERRISVASFASSPPPVACIRFGVNGASSVSDNLVAIEICSSSSSLDIGSKFSKPKLLSTLFDHPVRSGKVIPKLVSSLCFADCLHVFPELTCDGMEMPRFCSSSRCFRWPIIDLTTSHLGGPLPFNDFFTYAISCWSFNQFLELFWMYSWGNSSSKVSSMCLFKELFTQEKASLCPFISSSIFAAAVSNAAISLFSPETPVFHLDAYSTLHRKTLAHILQVRQVRTVLFLSWQLLQRWPVFPSAKAASLILADVSSSSFLLALASSSLNFNSCLFINEPFTLAK